ncbi:esterase-like activity of phytase family protein [Pontibacterium sp. N1Y112]|uniref:Esterase-like activity of phytase family protein n=1 Tax=Pontibacterium sinense TaxID=2781979 RepID=A0A8J7FND6_9GAMM|nr:esterase-like activity of phytase family protein [Pontibacterium sinense]MBE9399493.1 esterase-like activity of phytase family protein [Pontibacterium sinense]
MFDRTFRRSALAVMVAAVATGAQADAFNRIASFSTAKNLPAGVERQQETSAEIIAVSEDGKTLVYSDSPLEGLGFVDISDADEPKPAGHLKLEGEPTSVAIADDYVLTGVNTSTSYVTPTGFLAAIDLDDKEIEKRCDLGGQPDSIAVSKDGKYVAVAIENERDEDLNDGELPQLPAGFLVIAPLEDGKPDCDDMRRVEMTGLAEIGADDPEPEFVDFNDNNEIVVTLQENNHLVVVDAKTAKVINHFSAGSVDLKNVDLKKDRTLTFNKTQENRLREPDSVKWLDNDRFVTANEGDFNGGARGFTIFHKDGRVLYESAEAFEHQIIMAGHYPEKRSGKKGNEPEGLAIGTFGKDTYIFVLSERGGAIGVYRDTGAAPEFVQLLPSGIAPESAVTIPSRNLLVSANEKDLVEDKGPRSHVMVYKLDDDAAAYPQIKSGRNDVGEPIGWGALSGMTADAKKPGLLYAVNDSFYSKQPSIFTIDANQTPAKIVKATPVTRDGNAAEKLDLEGITQDGKGGFWLASEGKTKKKVPHAIYHVNANGVIDRTLNFPDALLKHEKRFGAEGITLIGDSLWIAIQRQWKDDPENTVKLVSYNLKTNTWGAVRYPTEAANKGWVGLSEITAYDDEVYIIERDNQIGEDAKIKRLYKVEQSELKPAPLGGELPVVKKELVRDFIPDLKALNGYVTDKIEGFTVDASGKGYAVTDNDGVDDSSGETNFFSVGKM